MSDVKKFKSALADTGLRISDYNDFMQLTVLDGGNECLGGFYLAPSDAPALCLAILEAAVGENSGQSIHSERAIANLQAEVACMAERAAAEADRVKLEQEALVLFRASGAYGSDRLFLKFSDLEEHAQKCWLAVARAARELNKEANNG